MRLRHWKPFGFMVGIAAIADPAAATVFCAHNTADIQAALTAAQANGEDDQIEITTGNIGASALTFTSSEGHSIELYGGYDGLNCENSAPLDATTSLDGQNTVRILYIHNPGDPNFICQDRWRSCETIDPLFGESRRFEIDRDRQTLSAAAAPSLNAAWKPSAKMRSYADDSRM